jgi:hypothetical protein
MVALAVVVVVLVVEVVVVMVVCGMAEVLAVVVVVLGVAILLMLSTDSIPAPALTRVWVSLIKRDPTAGDVCQQCRENKVGRAEQGRRGGF